MKKSPEGKRASLIYWERLTDMHLHVLVETQQVQKVDLNWTVLFIQEWNGMFANQPDFFAIPPKL